MSNLVDVSEAFDEWIETLTGSRPSGAFVSGRWVEGSSTTLSFSGHVQVANPKDLAVLPEGNRAEDAIKIFTKYALQINDEITYDSVTWKVYNIAKRAIGNYFKALCVRK